MILDSKDTKLYVNEFGELVSSSKVRLCCETYNLVIMGFHQHNGKKHIHYLLKLTELSVMINLRASLQPKRTFGCYLINPMVMIYGS